MRTNFFLPVLIAAAAASFGSANAQGVIVEEEFVAAPVVTAPGPIVVPRPYVVTPGVVVVHRPVVTAVPVIVPRAPLLAAEPIVVAPPICPYGYGYC